MTGFFIGCYFLLSFVLFWGSLAATLIYTLAYTLVSVLVSLFAVILLVSVVGVFYSNFLSSDNDALCSFFGL